MTEDQFAAKVDWEGGIAGALEYGMPSDDLPEGQLKAAWKRLESVYEEHYRPAERAVQEALENIDPEGDF